MNGLRLALIGLLCGLGSLTVLPSYAAADREKLLKDPGVYATFAVFKVDEDWRKLDKTAKVSAASEFKSVFQKHSDSVITDTFMLRGLVEKADFFVRIHSTEILSNQNFLLDLMGTTLGHHLVNTYTFNGLTKPANYVPSLPDEMKTALKTQTDAGPKPYAIVIPIRKDAEWWSTRQDDRNTMMKEHTEATLNYLKTVKRKLYHSSGLDDLDFITYFETAKLDDFNNLIIALERVKENHHNRQFGNPHCWGPYVPWMRFWRS